jgi:hypothetical protein
MTPIEVEVLKIIGILLGVAGILVAIKWYTKDPAPTPSATPATAPTEKEKPTKGDSKKDGDGGWTKLMKFITETAKAVISVSLCALVIFAAVRGLQIVRDWEPAQSKNSTTRTIRLSTEWSIPVSDYWGVGWRFKVDPPTTKGIHIRFIQGDEIVIEKFVTPNENNADVPPPPGPSELQIRLAGEEVRTHEAKVWTK